MDKAKIIRFLVSILLPQLVGLFASFFTVSSISSWYVNIQKPVFTPPSFVFAPAWTLLYFLMGISLFLIWNKKVNKKAIKLFGIQLFLNFLWSFLFFGLKSPILGFIGIIILWIFILFTIIEFYKIDKKAGILLIPYIIWVTFAGILNFSIFILNM